MPETDASLSWDILFSETGLRPDCDPGQLEIACAFLRLRRMDLLGTEPHLDLVVEQSRDAVVHLFSHLPEPERSFVLGKIAIHIPAKIERRASFWILEDGSAFVRFKSLRWKSLAPIFDRAAAALGSESPGKPAMAHTLARLAFGCRRTETFVPLGAPQAAAQIRTLCEPGELCRLDPAGSGALEWNPGVRVLLRTAEPVSPAWIAASADALGVWSSERSMEALFPSMEAAAHLARQIALSIRSSEN